MLDTAQNQGCLPPRTIEAALLLCLEALSSLRVLKLDRQHAWEIGGQGSCVSGPDAAKKLLSTSRCFVSLFVSNRLRSKAATCS